MNKKINLNDKSFELIIEILN